MAGHRILIVDDHRETTRVLRSALESLDHEFVIQDALSGEEAILDIARGNIDLLIIDVMLPGISGLDLVQKYKKNIPEMKYILISGVTDPKIRQQVAQAGADAFFFKPIELADFLDSVERSLGLVDTLLPSEMQVERQNLSQEEEGKGLAECIDEVYREVEADAVLLLGEMGQILARIGQLPDPEIETTLLPQLAIATGLGARVSLFMDSEYPDNLLSFRGMDYELHLTNVGEVYLLLVTTKAISATEYGKLSNSLQRAVEKISANLNKLGIPIGMKEQAEKIKPKSKPVESDISDPQLEILLKDKDKNKKEEADAFWEAAPIQNAGNNASSSDSLTYEQAKKLGLAPEDK